MEKFKKTIQIRAILFTILTIICLALIILDVYDVLIKIDFVAQNKSLTDFQMGIIVGLGFVGIFYQIKYLKALKDEKKLQLLYNEENDERKLLIRQKAGLPLLLITSGIMIFCGIILGYFNYTIFLTLTIAGFIQLMIGNIAKLYYLNKL